MSYDPYAYGADVPPPEPGVSDAVPGESRYAYQRVQAPGIALIVVGVLNLLVALFQVVGTVWIDHCAAGRRCPQAAAGDAGAVRESLSGN